MGYQSESAIWRNIYLTGARELRQGRADTVPESGPSYLMMATPFSDFLDLVETIVVPEKAGDAKLAFNLVDSMSGDRFAVTLGNAVLVSEKGQSLDGVPTLSAPKPVLLGILFGKVPLDTMVTAGQAKLTGDGAVIKQLVGMLEQPKLDFAIVEP